MKSLHERLRKWADETCPLNSAFADCGIDLIGCDDEVMTLFTQIADEIERCYVLLPADDKGEPWKVGDETDIGKISSLTWDGERWEALVSDIEESEMFLSADLKRPAPPALDADSLEKLRDDMNSWNELRCQCHVAQWADRLTAIIGRSA